MGIVARKDSLGLWEQPLPPGAHICHIFLSELERLEALVDFLRNGLILGERIHWISAQPAGGLIQAFLEDQGLSLAAAKAAGQVWSSCSRDFYLEEGSFDHQRTLGQWRRFHAEAKAAGFHGLRALGELPPELDRLGQGRAVVHYEVLLNEVFRHCPPTRAVCQYDGRAFSGRTLLGVLRAHPLVLVDRQVRANPHYLAPPGLGLS